MKQNWLLALSILILSAGAANSLAQQSGTQCPFHGTYRIDVDSSDRLYSVVEGATSSVPFGDQQRFFLDLSTRLTPPDLIAIECSGRKVSIASSRASKITFNADAVTRREQRGNGTYVNSRVVLRDNILTFTSSGRGEDDVNVRFQALGGGDRLSVVRRIKSAQLDEPLVIRTHYDRFAMGVDWGNFGEPGGRPTENDLARKDESPTRANTARAGEANKLRSALYDWIDATNKRDIQRQMVYYASRLKAYYLTRDTPREAVLNEKQRVFKDATSVDIEAAEPEIVFQDNGRTAVMRFNKKYNVAERSRTRSGEVIQELRWQKTVSGWRIISERDIRVIRQG